MVSILIDQKYAGCECILIYSDSSKYNSWSGNFILGSHVTKLDPSASVDFVYDEGGIHCNVSMNADAAGTITTTISSRTIYLDEQYIPETIARKSDLESISSQIPSQTSGLENDSNYISKAELQNILNQIEITTAEDGTIEIHIPTIS